MKTVWTTVYTCVDDGEAGVRLVISESKTLAEEAKVRLMLEDWKRAIRGEPVITGTEDTAFGTRVTSYADAEVYDESPDSLEELEKVWQCFFVNADLTTTITVASHDVVSTADELVALLGNDEESAAAI